MLVLTERDRRLDGVIDPGHVDVDHVLPGMVGHLGLDDSVVLHELVPRLRDLEAQLRELFGDLVFKSTASGKTYTSTTGGTLARGPGTTLTVTVVADEPGSDSSALITR